MEFVTDAEAFWIWLVVGTLLIVLEVATGTLFLLWPGVAALLLAAIAFFASDLSIALQIFLFAALAIGLGAFGRGYLGLKPGGGRSDRPNLNLRSAQLVGRRVTAIEDFENGFGPVSLDDSQWRARLEDADAVAAAGDPLKVTAVEGALLVVAPL